MKIAIFTDCFLPSVNGVVTSVVNCAKEMTKRGHEVLILTSYSRQRPNITGVKIKYFLPLKLFKYPDAFIALPDYRIVNSLIHFRPDIIHCHMPTPLCWQGILFGKFAKVPVIGTYHTVLPDFLNHLPLPSRINNSKGMNNLAWYYSKLFYNKCDLVTTPSKAISKKLIEKKIKKPFVISNGINLNIFQPKKAQKNGKTAIYVGRVSYEKNIDIVIRAFSELRKEIPDVHLKIYGDGPEKEKLKASLSDKLKNVEFCGKIKHEKLPSIYSKADFFISASEIETEGLVILEAMACGLPIVAVDALACPYIVKHNVNGFIAPPKNIDKLKKYMQILFNDNQLRRNMGAESIKIAQDYDLKKIIDKLELKYSSLITAKKKKKLAIH